MNKIKKNEYVWISKLFKVEKQYILGFGFIAIMIATLGLL